MKQDNKLEILKPHSGLPWILLFRWLLGIYVIATSISGALIIGSNWQQIESMRVIDPNFNLYPMFVAWGFKFATGILLLFRSKWLLVAIPIWVVFFVYDFLSRNTFSQLTGDFFLGFAIQGCILSFVLWMHSRGRLK